MEEPWARAATRTVGAGTATSAVYMRLRNAGRTDDTLLGVQAEVAAVAELHQSFLDNGVMRMRPIPSAALPAGSTLALEPGGLHVMLIDLREDLREGTEIRVRLRFERAGEIEVLAPVHPATGPAMKHGG